MKKAFGIFVFIIVVLNVFLGIYYFYSRQSAVGKVVGSLIKKSVNEGREIVANIKKTPAPTPLPFEELTIPYLRTKEIKSDIENLEKVSEALEYTSYLASYRSDNLKINGLLTIPKGERPEGGFPAVVFVHGYIPPRQYQTLSNYSSFIDYLARSNMVIFKIDLRGHADSEGEAFGGYYSSDYIIDTLSAYSALQGEDYINPKKIGLWGHSMAGNIVLRSFAVKPEIPAVVVWAGAGFSYLDLVKYSISDNSYQPPDTTTKRARRRQELFSKHGRPSEESEFWRKVAPTSYLGDLKGAIQLHHAVDDKVVDIGYSRDLNNLLNSTKVPHEFYEYQSGGHNIAGESFNSAMQRTIEFYQLKL